MIETVKVILKNNKPLLIDYIPDIESLEDILVNEYNLRDNEIIRIEIIKQTDEND